MRFYLGFRLIIEWIGEQVFRQWFDLDRLLLRLWESHSIRTEAVGSSTVDTEDVRAAFRCLLPEMTKRGVMDISGYSADVDDC